MLLCQIFGSTSKSRSVQVVRRKLAVAQPTVQYDGFMYEEGPDLDEDEVAGYAKFLGRPLNALPAGGIKDSSMVEVSDQAQKLELSIIVAHQVCLCCQLNTRSGHLAISSLDEYSQGSHVNLTGCQCTACGWDACSCWADVRLKLGPVPAKRSLVFWQQRSLLQASISRRQHNPIMLSTRWVIEDIFGACCAC